MNCKDCEHFKIIQEPLHYRKGIYFDLGKARCTKHDIYADYTQIGKLKCVEDKE